ncbi:MAG: MBL fold metallo-hydrolase [Ruminococcaceae bacterium]|nr:MBL fold metallo-hydrolase [Oscillospiraceae bacterium]
MNIECLVLGQLGVNCYLLTENNKAIVIDPGDEVEKILSALEDKGCSLEKILLTHGHFDHTGAVCDLAKKTGAEVFIHSGDEVMLRDNSKNLSFLTGEEVKTYEEATPLETVEKLTFGNMEIKYFHTPGHSEGSVTYQVEDNLFCGDLIFRGSIGRYDFGDLRTELNSINFLLENFGDSVKLFPGHGMKTTIGFERMNNPYIGMI